MKRNVKIFCAALALVLVFGAVVGGTIAWLTSNTEQIVNTFTVGNVSIELTESPNPLLDDGDDDENTNSYKMIPGDPINKDPKVTVLTGSEDCYLFIEVEEGNELDNFIQYDLGADWKQVGDSTTVFYYDGEITKGTPISVLAGDKVTVKNVGAEDMEAAEGALPTLGFKAYAIQKANVGSDSATADANAVTAWDFIQQELNN